MADSFISKLITELTEKTTAADTDLVPIADSNGNFFKMTWQKMKQLLLGTKDISGVGDGTVTGAISELNTKKVNVQSGHTCEIGLSAANARIFPYINIDGAQIDLIPNNIDQIGNVKILNAKILYNTSPWKLQLEIYIDGAVYYKKVNLSD